MTLIDSNALLGIWNTLASCPITCKSQSYAYSTQLIHPQGLHMIHVWPTCPLSIFGRQFTGHLAWPVQAWTRPSGAVHSTEQQHLNAPIQAGRLGKSIPHAAPVRRGCRAGRGFCGWFPDPDSPIPPMLISNHQTYVYTTVVIVISSAVATTNWQLWLLNLPNCLLTGIPRFRPIPL